MIVSKKILNQWIDVKRIKDQDIAKALNSLGFEVEKIINLTSVNTHLIVGEILKIEEHPKIKRLNFCYVNIGRKVLKIICGANNVQVGIKVVVAQVGSKLANGMVIVDREIQGIMSHGMICSLSELGLNPEVLTQEDLDGIVHLPDSAPVGSLSPLNYLALDDTIFEINLTLNRSDCLAIYYLAQELSHYFKLPLKEVEFTNFKNIKIAKQVSHSFMQALASVKINLLNPIQIENNWIKRTLQLSNIKPKSFFDDLVSLVMLELGQPVIAFDSNELEAIQVVVANKDYLSKNFQYFKDDIVFNNRNENFSNLAVSTLSNYLITPQTKSIMFVSLNLTNGLVQNQIKRNNFNPNSLLLQRLSKPIIPINYLLVLKRILFLLNQFNVKFEVISFINIVNYQVKDNIRSVDYQMINHLLGTTLSAMEITNALKVIDCKVLKKTNKLTTVKIVIPPYRNDLNNVNDFAEEVARVVGYNNLPKIKPKFINNPMVPSELELLLADLKSYLLNYGFHQVKTYNLTNKDNLADFNFFNYKKAITLISPINLARKAMRFSLIPSLLEICRLNSSYKQDSLKIFTDEVIYTNDHSIKFSDANLNHHLAFMIHENFFSQELVLDTYANTESNNNPAIAANYLLIKGFLEAWLTKQGGDKFTDALVYQKIKNQHVHPYLSSEIKYNNIHFATIAALHPQISKEMTLGNNLFIVEINFNRLTDIIIALKAERVVEFENWSKFNPLSRDLSIIISQEIDYADVKNVIWSARTKYLEKVTLIDVYRASEKITKKERSLTFNLEFNSKKEQLDEEKVSHEIKLIQTILKERFNVTIR